MRTGMSVEEVGGCGERRRREGSRVERGGGGIGDRLVWVARRSIYRHHFLPCEFWPRTALDV